MRASHRVTLILAFAVLPASLAGAQTMPWPTDAPRPAAGAGAPWPGSPGGPAPTPMAPMGAPPPQAMAPQGGPFSGGGGGNMPPCLTEFTKLREDVEAKGRIAKNASEHKATREEMCKHLQVYAAAETKWVKFAETQSASCGIPPQVAQQLKQVHSNTEQTREKVCAAGGGGPGPAAAPSLSDALGTSRLPTADTEKNGGGTLDTLTGYAIQR